MTTNLTQVSHSRSTSQQFLISKTDAKPSVVTPLRKLSPNKDALLAAFPELHFGQSLIDTAMGTLNSAHKFGALAIRIDETNPEWTCKLMKIDEDRALIKIYDHNKLIGVI